MTNEKLIQKNYFSVTFIKKWTLINVNMSTALLGFFNRATLLTIGYHKTKLLRIKYYSIQFLPNTHICKNCLILRWNFDYRKHEKIIVKLKESKNFPIEFHYRCRLRYANILLRLILVYLQFEMIILDDCESIMNSCPIRMKSL